MKCRQGFQKPPAVRKPPKRKIVPSPEWTQKILEAAEQESERDFLMLATMAEGGLRRSEVVGTDDKRAKARNGPPGIRVQDIRDNGILIHGKLGKEVVQPINPQLIARVRAYIGQNRRKPDEKVFIYSTDGLLKLCRKYGKRVGYPDWAKLHPHSLRHFYGTFIARKVGRDPFKVRDMMRHTDLKTTNTYVDELQPDEKDEIAKLLVQKTA